MLSQAPGFEKLTTAFYFKGDPYLTSDAVFGVKSSLVVVRQSPCFWLKLFTLCYYCRTRRPKPTPR
jgi:hypothetical protein